MVLYLHLLIKVVWKMYVFGAILDEFHEQHKYQNIKKGPYSIPYYVLFLEQIRCRFYGHFSCIMKFDPDPLSEM